MITTDDLKARRDRLAKELAKLDEILAGFHSYASEFAPDLLAARPASKNERRPSPPNLRSSRAPADQGGARQASVILDLTARIASQAMESANAPLSLAALEGIMRTAAVPMPASDHPRNVIGTRMSRCGKFRSIPGLGWWFKDRPLPNAVEADHQRDDLDEPSVVTPDARGEQALAINDQ